jgi:4-hydroxy-tetrahydrodipicolinate reductase
MLPQSKSHRYKYSTTRLVRAISALSVVVACQALVSPQKPFRKSLLRNAPTWNHPRTKGCTILIRRNVRQLSSTSSKTDNFDVDDIYVMVNGMPGPMATAAAEACLRKGLQLSPMAITGPDVEPSTITVVDPISKRNMEVRLIPSSDTNEVIASLAGIREAVGVNNLLAIDYTHPSAVNSNGRFYVQNNVPFVMGTTGGNRDELLQDVQGHFCVIAPNMGKQIVAMQAALSDLGNRYPGAFAGYKLDVIESHQKTKADTSGTAKAVIDSIKVLTSDTTYTYDDIKMIRNDDESIQFGVPKDAIQGHAFHTYTLTSPDGSVQFQLQHNVAGRTIYAEGTADAIKFLARKIRTESVARVYTMIDVLEEGALE